MKLQRPENTKRQGIEKFFFILIKVLFGLILIFQLFTCISLPIVSGGFDWRVTLLLIAVLGGMWLLQYLIGLAVRKIIIRPFWSAVLPSVLKAILFYGLLRLFYALYFALRPIETVEILSWNTLISLTTALMVMSSIWCVNEVVWYFLRSQLNAPNVPDKGEGELSNLSKK